MEKHSFCFYVQCLFTLNSTNQITIILLIVEFSRLHIYMYNVKITSDLLLVIDICHIKIVRTRLGVDRVIKVHRRSEKAMEGHGRSWKVFSCHWIDISGEKSYWWWWWPVGL